MTTLYALLVGVNRYAAPDVPDLRGCVRDVAAARAYLERTYPDTELCVRTLVDGQGTREAVLGAIRTHLGQATPEDTVLFWFSGHGSYAWCPEWAWFTEPSGQLQTLVCADSRTRGVPDIWDKELSVLLDDIAGHAAHVAVVLDSCHSDGATREIPAYHEGVRTVPEAAPRSAASLVPELHRAGAGPGHIAMAACRSDERARETLLDGEVRGVFSWALLRALDTLGRHATYRELTVAAGAEVERRVQRQRPQLHPAASALIDHPFLAPRPGPRGSAMWMRYVRGEWEINAGAVHGLPPDAGLRVGVRGGTPAQQASVVEVQTQRSRVEPADGWRPERERVFPVVVTNVPEPRLTVAVTGRDPETVRRLTLELHTAGPGGGPSPHLRVVTSGPARLAADVHPSGLVTLADEHGHTLAEVQAEEAMGALEHIARWTTLSTLANPRSELAGKVRIEIVGAEAGVAIAPREGGPMLEPVGGELTLRYRPDRRPPEIFIRLRNHSSRPLYCVLLDLTPRFRVHAALFPGAFIAAGGCGTALRGGRIKAYLPDGLAAEPGARARDRLVLLVAEQQFSAEPFLLPALGERAARERGPGGPRDLGGAEPGRGAYEWATESVTLVTEVP